jgi:hypothetical protein
MVQASAPGSALELGLESARGRGWDVGLERASALVQGSAPAKARDSVQV